MSDLFSFEEAPPAAPQVVPHSREAEEAVLGAVLINPEVYYEVSQFLRPDDFYLQRHRWLWESFMNLQERRAPIDFLTVVEELDQTEYEWLLPSLGSTGPTTVIYIENPIQIVDRYRYLVRWI